MDSQILAYMYAGVASVMLGTFLLVRSVNYQMTWARPMMFVIMLVASIGAAKLAVFPQVSDDIKEVIAFAHVLPIAIFLVMPLLAYFKPRNANVKTSGEDYICLLVAAVLSLGSLFTPAWISAVLLVVAFGSSYLVMPKYAKQRDLPDECWPWMVIAGGFVVMAIAVFQSGSVAAGCGFLAEAAVLFMVGRLLGTKSEVMELDEARGEIERLHQAILEALPREPEKGSDAEKHFKLITSDTSKFGLEDAQHHLIKLRPLLKTYGAVVNTPVSASTKEQKKKIQGLLKKRVSVAEATGQKIVPQMNGRAEGG